jgi:spore germination cell wall hydrolase CwlJ-like protein
MSEFSRLKKILTWTIMSTTVLALTATPLITNATEDRAFGFKIANAQQKQTKVLERQLACLARNVFYEANGEPMAGQMAVAQVTVNRARSGLFPNDLCAVIAQSTIVGSDTKVCQFSWYCDSDINKSKVIKPSESSYIAARRVFLEGQKVAKIDQDVMWFHQDSIKVNPRWPHKVATKIGNHVFYKREK